MQECFALVFCVFFPPFCLPHVERPPQLQNQPGPVLRPVILSVQSDHLFYKSAKFSRCMNVGKIPLDLGQPILGARARALGRHGMEMVPL